VQQGNRLLRQGYFALSLLGTLLAGCTARLADYRSLDLVTVSGVVTLDGQPLAGATVLFEGADRSFSSGTTDKAGRYQLSYSSEQRGVKPGRKTVRIRTRPVTTEEPTDGGRSEEAAPIPERIPARYNVQSVLSADVDARHGRFDFALQSTP
jgi:hypothetical protein